VRDAAERLGVRAGLGLYLVALLWLTLAAYPDAGAGARNLVPGRTIAACAAAGGGLFVWNVVGNVAAFVPLGLALRGGAVGRRWRLRWALAAGAGLSLLIEALQYRGGRRVADVDDVLLNALGALLGAALLDLAAGLAAVARERHRAVAAGGRVG
jgi:glycopeptide antibiotics resistance protein